MSTPVLAPSSAPRFLDVKFEHSRNLPEMLAGINASVLVSTYQAGRLVVLGTHERTMKTSFHAFENVMGVAVGPGRIAVGTRRQIWFLRFVPDLGYISTRLANTAFVSQPAPGVTTEQLEEMLAVLDRSIGETLAELGGAAQKNTRGRLFDRETGISVDTKLADYRRRMSDAERGEFDRSIDGSSRHFTALTIIY